MAHGLGRVGRHRGRLPRGLPAPDGSTESPPRASAALAAAALVRRRRPRRAAPARDLGSASAGGRRALCGTPRQRRRIPRHVRWAQGMAGGAHGRARPSLEDAFPPCTGDSDCFRRWSGAAPRPYQFCSDSPVEAPPVIVPPPAPSYTLAPDVDPLCPRQLAVLEACLVGLTGRISGGRGDRRGHHRDPPRDRAHDAGRDPAGTRTQRPWLEGLGEGPLVHSAAG